MPYRDKYGWERLADVQVPRGFLWAILLGLWLRQRSFKAAVDEFGDSANALGEYLGTSWRETHEREVRLVELQASIEKLTRWLVRLTVALGVLGIASIAVSIWAVTS